MCYIGKRPPRRNIKIVAMEENRGRVCSVDCTATRLLLVDSPLVVYIASLFTPLLDRCRM